MKVCIHCTLGRPVPPGLFACLPCIDDLRRSQDVQRRTLEALPAEWPRMETTR